MTKTKKSIPTPGHTTILSASTCTETQPAAVIARCACGWTSNLALLYVNSAYSREAVEHLAFAALRHRESYGFQLDDWNPSVDDIINGAFKHRQFVDIDHRNTGADAIVTGTGTPTTVAIADNGPRPLHLTVPITVEQPDVTVNSPVYVEPPAARRVEFQRNRRGNIIGAEIEGA